MNTDLKIDYEKLSYQQQLYLKDLEIKSSKLSKEQLHYAVVLAMYHFFLREKEIEDFLELIDKLFQLIGQVYIMYDIISEQPKLYNKHPLWQPVLELMDFFEEITEHI